MIRRLQFTIFSVFLVFVAMTTAFAEAPPTVYKSKKSLFSFNVPANWEAKETNEGMEVTVTAPVQEHAPNQYRPNARISMEVLVKDQTMAEYSQTAIAKLRTRLTDLKFLKTGRQGMSNNNARWWLITYREKSVTVKGVLFIVLKGRKAVTISSVAAIEQYQAYKEALSDFGESLTIY